MTWLLFFMHVVEITVWALFYLWKGFLPDAEAAFLLDRLKHHVQEYNRVGARVQAGLLFLATIALLIPSAVSQADAATTAAFTRKLSLGLAVLLIVAYWLGMLFSLKTHRELFASAQSGEAGETDEVLMVHLVFAMTLHLLPPRAH